MVVLGDAAVSDDPPAHAVPDYVEKYAAFIARNSWTPESFAADYSCRCADGHDAARLVAGYAGGRSGETGRLASPRGSASRSSTSAVSAIGTPVRCRSRLSKSAITARSASA